MVPMIMLGFVVLLMLLFVLFAFLQKPRHQMDEEFIEWEEKDGQRKSF